MTAAAPGLPVDTLSTTNMDIAFNGPRRNCERSCQYCFNHEKNIDMDDFELSTKNFQHVHPQANSSSAELLHSNRTECPHRDPSYGTPELSGFDAHSVLGSHLPEAPYERSMDPHDLLDNIASHQPRDYLYQFTSPLQNEVDIEKTNENELSSFTSTIAATECERPSPTDFNPLQRLDTGMIPKEYSTQESPSSMNNQPLGNSISIVPDHDFILCK